MNDITKKQDLTKGRIVDTLIALTLPILGTSLITMLHSIVDMWCVGRLGSMEVAATGTGGFYIWMSVSLSAISRIGAQVKVAQSIGEKKIKEACEYVQNGLLLTLIIGILLGFILVTQNRSLVEFYRFKDARVVEMGRTYVMTIGFAMPFFFLNPVMSAVYQARGNSKLPFVVNTVCLGGNLLLNFVLIFGLGPFPALKVFGAALATSLAQALMSLIFLTLILQSKDELFRFDLVHGFKLDKLGQIAKIGFPFGLQDSLFSLISIFMARLITSFGNSQIAAYRVGSNIEALSWETSVGFSSALTSFVGQNYGAKKTKRIFQAYRTAILLSSSIGLLAFVLFFFFGAEIFRLFFPKEGETVVAGACYLKIMSYSQIFMCIEITTSGLFSGLSKTYISSVIGIVFTLLRIPFAYYLSRSLGIEGVWWVITFSSILKGIVSLAVYLYQRKFHPRSFFEA